MKILFLGIAVGALGIAVPAAATDGSQAAAPAKPKKEHRICKTRVRSGSNLATTVCKTNAEWAALEGTYDPDSEVGVPGNRAATGRETNVGGLNRATMDRPH
jgi:hypothetical protein